MVVDLRADPAVVVGDPLSRRPSARRGGWAQSQTARHAITVGVSVAVVVAVILYLLGNRSEGSLLFTVVAVSPTWTANVAQGGRCSGADVDPELAGLRPETTVKVRTESGAEVGSERLGPGWREGDTCRFSVALDLSGDDARVVQVDVWGSTVLAPEDLDDPARMQLVIRAP